MATLNRIVVFRMPDGTALPMCFMSGAKKDNQTEDEFIQQELNKLFVDCPQYANYERFIKPKSEFRQFVLSTQAKNWRSVKISSKGDFSETPNWKSDEELRLESKSKLRDKLKLGETLNDKDIDLIIGRS